MSDPRPDEFVEFVELLTEDAPDGYEPWLFRVERASKAPDLSYGSWKDESARLDKHEAVQWMQSGGNVGIAGRPDGPLINVDIDDEDETTISDLKQTLIARSRSRSGVHAWYFEAPGADIPNIPTEEAGEVRANWQYVVAPGSYVDTDPQVVPEDERSDAGYYTVERADPVTSLRLDELPVVFREHDNPDPDAQEIKAPDVSEFGGDGGGGGGSALFEITARDVVRKEGGGSTNAGDRWAAIFHGSDTGKNMSLSSQGHLQCWRHEVTHNGLQALCVLSEYNGGCADVGAGHKRSGAGSSCLHHEDGAHVWHAWKYAKQSGYIPDDDPVPYAALKHICRERDICAESDIPSEYDPDSPDGRLPEYAYNGAIESIEGHDGVDPGRQRTDATTDSDDAPAPDTVPESEPDTESDGGAAAANATEPAGASPAPAAERVQAAVREANNDVISNKQARQNIARAFDDGFHFLYPEEGVQNWPSGLYVYTPDEGIYEPRGEAVITRELDRLAGAFATNAAVREIVEKIKRRNMVRGDLDEPPGKLVVENGILDLADGTLTEHTPDKYHRTKISVRWDPAAGEPDAIDTFLHEVVNDDDVATLYRLIASCLWKDTIADKAGMLIGSGQNGKSVFLDLVKEFLDGRHNVASKELHELTDYKFARKELIGKLANLATEVGDRKISHTTYFKKLTSGDPDQAPDYHTDPIPFRNHATMLFATNEMPRFGEDNHAIWRRWVYVEFPHTFDRRDPEAKDPEPEQVLKDRLFDDDEFAALLLRCQQELARWQDGEPLFIDAMDPDAVREKMKAAAEPVFSFAQACLERGDLDEDSVAKSTVRAAYQEYADHEDLPRIPRNEFGERLLALRDYRIEDGRSNNNKRVYRGVRLSPIGRQMAGLDEPDDDQQQVDDVTDTRKIVRDQLRAMADNGEGEPVPRSAVVWAVRDKVTNSEAEHAIDRLVTAGELVERDNGLLPT